MVSMNATRTTVAMVPPETSNVHSPRGRAAMARYNLLERLLRDTKAIQSGHLRAHR